MKAMAGLRGVLVVVPCGRRKIWAAQPQRGPTRADDAYTGTLFALNRAYAERFGDAWVVLSGKYGFIPPDFEVEGPYEVTFTRASSHPVTHEALREQVAGMELDRYDMVVGLGGKAYRNAIIAAFDGTRLHLAFPFAGLPIGRMLQATKRALESGHPGFVWEERG